MHCSLITNALDYKPPLPLFTIPFHALKAAVTFFFFFFFFAFQFSGKKFVPPPPHFSAPSYATEIVPMCDLHEVSFQTSEQGITPLIFFLLLFLAILMHFQFQFYRTFYTYF